MDISHLHLHVRDRERAVAFYRRWFGLAVVNRGEAMTFMQGGREFLLALMDDPAPAPMPPWFHFGILLDSREAVATMLAAMTADGVSIAKALHDSPTLVSFRCADPDGYVIEIYWATA